MMMTFPELLFSTMFLMFVNVGAVIALLPDKRTLQLMRAIAASEAAAIACLSAKRRKLPPGGAEGVPKGDAPVPPAGRNINLFYSG